MNFMEIIKPLKEGKKVRRKKWDNQEFVIFKSDGGLVMKQWAKDILPDTKDYWLLDLESIEATDWEIYNEQEKTLTYEIKEYFSDNAYPQLSKLFEILRNHNQKLKEDIDKLMDDDVLKSYKIIKIIDKRAGKLE